ncbi:MAG: EAL domain-containing protein, partial [Oscillospiraceae bacterium]|nr:EAL domain-containing protein [Oscillospiraceae bacterium]
MGISAVPISINMSRYDIYRHNYTAEIEAIRKRYDIPVELLHVEITESSAIGGMELVSNVLSELHKVGYVVEMDDFGSGYSSLNVLKDLDVDVIKLDMRFLSGKVGGRGGTIISSVVQMTKWLGTPVVAEGVETVEQADYMKSIGCSYIQGYLYSKPVEEPEFLRKLRDIDHEPVVAAVDLINTMNSCRFWDPNSLETLIFNQYVGGAAIFSYCNDKLELLRVNQKYMKEIGMNMSEKDVLGLDPWEWFDEDNRRRFTDAIQHAIHSRDEVACDTWRMVCSRTCGMEQICLHTEMRVIGQAGDQYLFYALIKDVTAEKKRYDALYDSERRFRFASEQANVYAWEYTFSNKQMRPCFRCMRDLGLPALVENYPEPAIEMGIFPPDYADFYREYMRQLEQGIEPEPAIIPLTVGRVPFYIRYTIERDENGKPLKAYGSATLVVDDEKEKQK